METLKKVTKPFCNYCLNISFLTVFLASCLTVSIYEISAADVGSARCPNGTHRTPSGDCEKFLGIDPTNIQSTINDSSSSTFPSSINTVTIASGSSIPSNNRSFEPNILSVVPGAIVTWINQDTTLHTVTSGTPQGGNSGIEFNSSYLATGKTFQNTFFSPGTFDYYCTLHPFMTGSIKVSTSPTSEPVQTNNTSNLNTANQGTLGYSNYTSNKYQIQFQYPTNWELKEKANRFDEGTDVAISNPNPGGGLIMIVYGNDLRAGFGSPDFTTAFYKLFKDSISSDYSKEYRVIEKPSFLTVDGQKAGTYLYTSKDKYEDYASTWGTQNWLVFVGTHGYLISFFGTTDTFDSPENIAIRDKFINSIKFLGASNSTAANQTSRFD